MKSRRYELSDLEWSIIEPLLPNKPRGVPLAAAHGFAVGRDSRALWACYNRFVRWAKIGVWDRIFEAISRKGPDSDITTGLRCLKQHFPMSRTSSETRPSGSANVDGYPCREKPIGADIGLSVQNHDDRGAIVEMGIEVSPFIAASFRVDALTVLKFGDFNRGDAKFLIVGPDDRQP